MNLPPYISRTPPPLNETEDDEDEEFGTFAVCSDLGEEVCDVFEKNSHLMRGDDNVSEDSGFCMNSVCQTQSPCDVSPLSSSYNKGNECMGLENHGSIVNSSPKETAKSNDLKLNDSCFDQSSFTQEFDTFQSNDIYIDSSDAVESLEFTNKSFENKISDSESSVEGIEKVDFVENDDAVHFVANIQVNGDILLSDDFSQVVNDSSLQESLKINETDDWFKTSCQKVKIVDNTSPANEHSIVTNNQLELPEKTTSFVQDAETGIGFPEFSTSSCLKKNNEYFSNDNVYEENIELVDHWGSEDDDFSDFTGFQVVESITERPFSEFEFQFGESEIVLKETTEHVYGTLQSAIESNCLWNSLKYFEDTSAFKYQWSTSCTQMKFLQALHIDSRNILCGPWNKMNKINLADSSCSFESTYNVDTSSTTISTRNREVIPDAHFDWITSGLINPLQGTSNEKEILHNLEEKNVSETLKSRSQDVLSSLPNHHFLKLTYISYK